MPWIIPPPISSCHQLAHAVLQQHGVTPGRVVEADQEAVIASLVVSGVSIAFMREEAAYETAAAGEVCIWNDEQISTMLWFITQRQCENNPVIHALNEMQRDLWARLKPADHLPPRPTYLAAAPRDAVTVKLSSQRKMISVVGLKY